jgi:SAM-dependent methyltransferase
MRIQYGCGFSSARGWRNFDASPTLRVERLPLIGRLVQKNARRFPSDVEFGDIVRGLPVPDASAECVYASHVLEHLSLDDMRLALRNTLRVMAPGAVFRLIVPDLETLARRYIESRESGAALEFVRATCMGSEARPRGPLGMLTSMMGNSRHLWMWDLKSIRDEVVAAGFTDVRVCTLGDADHPAFAEVESPDRFVDSVALECRKR